MAVRIFVTTFVLLSLASLAPGAGPFEQQLRKESDALAAIAIQRPYGVGFDPSGRPDTRRPTTRPVSLEPLQTPAAGVALLWAGQFLDEPRYLELAEQIARATALGQAPPGQFPSHLIFGAKPVGREEPSSVPDRAPTLASTALMLSLLDAKPEADARLVGAAQRALTWIARQRTPAGAWPSAAPVHESEKEPIRLIRPGEPDYRNCILALLLGGEVLNDADHTAAAVKSLEHLLSLRVASRTADRPTFWAGAYDLAGAPAPGKAGLPDSIDLLATRYSMQSLLAGYLMIGDRKYGQACDEIVRLLPDMTMHQDMWRRFPEAREANEPPPMFGVPAASEFGSLGLPEAMNSTRQLKLLGRDEYRKMLSGGFTPQQHVAAALVGFRDQPLMLDLPVAASEVPAYLELHRVRFAVLEAPLPEAVSERTARLWLLLIRAKLERMAN